jgi:hypothetical protein
MWQRDSYGRRVLISGSPHSWAYAKAQFAELVAKQEALLAELANLQREVAELREIFQIVGTLRTQAETDVATLRHQLEVAVARLECDPARPLN